MFIKNINYHNYIRTNVINIGKELGLDTADEAFIKLREMDTRSIIRLKSVADGENNQEEILNTYREILPDLIVDHNLFITSSQKMTNKEVVDLIFDRIDLTLKVINETKNENFFRSATENAEK